MDTKTCNEIIKHYEKNVLVIDDSDSIRFLLEFVLQENYSVKSLENGMDALVYLQEGNIPDLIISDLEMPKMNGINFIQNIKSSSFFKSIPLLVLSGRDDSKDRIACFREGADDFLVKPFNPEELKLRIANISKRNSQAA